MMSEEELARFRAMAMSETMRNLQSANRNIRIAIANVSVALGFVSLAIIGKLVVLPRSPLWLLVAIPAWLIGWRLSK